MNYGRYNIVQELGRGAMGVVYQAHDPQIDRLVALKVLREDRVTSDDFVKRFLKEAKAIGRLSHPGIVIVYDIGQDHGTIYIAMEYLDGTPLDAVMDGQKFSSEEIVDIGAQVARALDYAHQKGIIHRDIKPPNIICTSDGTVKVTDFGIARIEDATGQQQTKAGEILGTPLYMSPEQVSGLTVDGRSDIYSLGLILYELATGQRPFKGSNLTTIFKAITQDLPQPPIEVAVEIPTELSRIIMRCLDKDPANRFPSGRDLAEALTNALKPPKKQPSEKKNPVRKKSRLMPIILLTLCLAGLGAGGMFIYTFYTEKPMVESSSPITIYKKQTDNSPQTQKNLPPPVSKPLEDLADIALEETKPATFLFSAPEKSQENKYLQQPLSKIEPKSKKKTIPPHEEPVHTSPPQESIFELIPQHTSIDITPAVKTHPETVPTADILKKEPEKKNRDETIYTTLKVKSRPVGAKIFVNGDFKGNTPVELLLPADKYEIQLRLKGHLDWQAQLDLSSGGEVPLSLRLLPEE